MCCTWAVVDRGEQCPGRPFVVAGHARVPAIVERTDWSRPSSPRLAALTAHQRDVLARAWALEGCHEAASVASFSRFILQLAALGAPASLVLRAQRAIADEVEHARVFFGFAAAYGERPVGPATLPIAGSLDGMDDPVEIAVSLANEGCIAETISALQLAEAARRTDDPALRTALQEIAEQELQHAELAWSALAWMVRNGDDRMRAAVADAFVHATAAVPRAVSLSDALDEDTLRACGRLSSQQRLDLATRALERTIAPAAAALLAPWTTLSSAARPEPGTMWC